MNKYLVEGLEKFLKSQEEKKKDKKPVRKLKESLKLKESFGTRVANWYDKTYNNAFEAERKHGSQYFTIGTSLGKVEEVDDYMEFLGDMLKKYDPSLEKDIDKIIDGMSDEDKKTIAKHYGIYLNPEELSEIAKDGEGLDEGYNKQLKEETNMDKINKYLVSIGEAPITESIEEDEKKSPFDRVMDVIDQKGVDKPKDDEKKPSVTPRAKGGVSNFDKVKKVIGITESKKVAKRPMNLMESLNNGFSKLYGDFDDSKSLVESKGNKKKSLKENYEKQSDRLSSFLAGSGKGNLLLKGDEEEYGKPHLSSIVLDAAKKKGYKVFDLGRMDLTKDYEEQGFNSPKTLAFVDGYIPRKNASSILALLDDSDFKGKIVVIEYPDRPLDIAVKSRLVESKQSKKKKS